MKLYKVDYFVYELANSLLPPRDPQPEEESPVDEAFYMPTPQKMVELLTQWGFTAYQAEHLYRAIFNHYWYDFGIREVRHCNEMTWWWIDANIRRAVVQRDEVAIPKLPPVVIYCAVVVSIIAVVVLLVAPEFEETYKWTPPCNLYLGVYEEQLWWVCLVGVSAKQVPWYYAFSYSGAAITAHTYEYIAPPVVTDRLHFWGTLEFRCWQIPWFRVYRAQYADTTFVGLLTRTAGHTYKLKDGYTDHWAPRGPMVVPFADWCKKVSPCHV